MIGKLYLNNNTHSKYILIHYEMYELGNYNITKIDNNLNIYPYLEINGEKYYGTNLQDKLLENIGINRMHLDKYPYINHYHTIIENYINKK